jgi:hypothetical protein
MPANSMEPTLDIAIPPLGEPVPIPEPYELTASIVQFTMIKELTFEVACSLSA